MKHQKRQAVPRKWPVSRKGTTFTIKTKSGRIPLLVVLREMLGVVKNRRECKRALHENKIEINMKPAKDIARGVNLLDVITIVPSKKSYVLKLSKTGKYAVFETKDNEEKPIKIMNKTLLKGKKMQLNLIDGRNILTDQKCKTHDSVLFNFKNKKITKILEMKKGANVMVYAGKHSGEEGVIEEINEEKKTATIKTKESKIDALIKQIIVLK